MVRFEKLIWESIVNSKALGRERVIGTPKKWFTANRHREVKVAAHYYYTEGIRSKLFKSVEGIMSWFFWKWPRDIAVNKGLAMEDFLVHQERELRRDYLFEHIIRQSCHPYQHLMFRRRRARYFKVERAVRGFIVPDHVKKDAENRLLVDTIDVKDEWEDHMYNNYYSDMTPSTRYTAMHRLIPLEIFNVYGIFREEAWERFFYNEVLYDYYTEADYKAAETPFGNFNLEREDQRKSFEAEVNRFIKIYPGTLVKEGDQFNFKEFYAKHALVNGKDTSKLEPKLVEELRVKLQEPTDVSSLSLPDEKVGKPILGSDFPARLRSKYRKVLMQ